MSFFSFEDEEVDVEGPIDGQGGGATGFGGMLYGNGALPLPIDIPPPPPPPLLLLLLLFEGPGPMFYK